LIVVSREGDRAQSYSSRSFSSISRAPKRTSTS
jgi:hypothetical protein